MAGVTCTNVKCTWVVIGTVTVTITATVDWRVCTCVVDTCVGGADIAVVTGRIDRAATAIGLELTYISDATVYGAWVSIVAFIVCLAAVRRIGVNAFKVVARGNLAC